MINPYQSTTEVTGSQPDPERSQAWAWWLGITSIACGFGFIPLALVAFNLSMGPYYPLATPPLWFEYGQVLILILPVAAEILGVAYFFVRRHVPNSFAYGLIDLGCGLVVVVLTIPIVISLTWILIAIFSQFTSSGPTIILRSPP